MLVLDKHGYEIGTGTRGFRVCGHCGAAMSAGYTTDNGDIYACTDLCLTEQGWDVPTSDEDGACYWTEWEEYGEEDWVIEDFNPETGPVTFTGDGMPRLEHQLEAWHTLGAHNNEAHPECNYCKQLFDDTHDEAVNEAEADYELDIIA